MTTFDHKNLRKHGVTRDEVLEVFQSNLSLMIELEPSKQGHQRLMIVGWTFGGRLLEIGIEFFHFQDHEHIFHGMDAGKNYRVQFERSLRDGI